MGALPAADPVLSVNVPLGVKSRSAEEYGAGTSPESLLQSKGLYGTAPPKHSGHRNEHADRSGPRGPRILVDARSQKIDRFAGRCAAWTEKVEGALQTDPLTLSRFRRAERSTITTGVPSNIMADWQITRGRIDALIQIAGEAATSKGGPWRFWVGLLVGFVFGAISTFVTAVVLPSDRIDAVRAAVHNLFNRA